MVSLTKAERLRARHSRWAASRHFSNGSNAISATCPNIPLAVTYCDYFNVLRLMAGQLRVDANYTLDKTEIRS
jgi:hypothetical protein